MRLRIAQDVLALFPEALIGVVRVRGCGSSVRSPEIAALLGLDAHVLERAEAPISDA